MEYKKIASCLLTNREFLKIRRNLPIACGKLLDLCNSHNVYDFSFVYTHI